MIDSESSSIIMISLSYDWLSASESAASAARLCGHAHFLLTGAWCHVTREGSWRSRPDMRLRLTQIIITV